MTGAVITERRREFWILLAVIVTMTVNQTAIVIISPLAVAIADEFDTTVSLTGQLRTVAALVSAGLAPFVGLLSDRFGRRPIMLAGLLAITAFGFASAVAPTFGLLMAVQAIAGFGIASLLSSGYAVAADAFPRERRAWAVGVISIGQPMAWVFGLPLIGLVADSFGWRWSFIAVPMLFSLVGIAFLRWVPGPARYESMGRIATLPLAGLGEVLRNRSARSWILSELMAYSGWSGTLVYLGAYYITVHDQSTAATGILLAMTALGFVAGSLLSHRTASRLGAKPTILLGAGLSSAVLIATMTIQPVVWVSLVLLIGFGMMQGIRGAAASVVGLAQSPRQQGIMMGFRASVVQLGYVFGGITGGVLLAIGGYSLLGVCFALVIFGAAYLMAANVGEYVEESSE